MKKLAIVGARGMVGQVLMQRMQKEGDFTFFKTTYFSTSQAGKPAPLQHPHIDPFIYSAQDETLLRDFDIILTTQGSDYSQEMHPRLRQLGWKGFWIDAASLLRYQNDSVLLLDPINESQIVEAIDRGVKDFIGANCTVSLLLLALKGLLREDLVEWISSMTYQAASGAGAQAMEDLLNQLKATHLIPLSQNILEQEKQVTLFLNERHDLFATLGVPLGLNLFPWIDKQMENGQTKEEWKAQTEAQKILGRKLPLDGLCVRVPALRCHSQALTIKLKKNISLQTVEDLIRSAHPYLRWVENEKEATLKNLTPLTVTGTLDIAVGRVRPMNLGPDFLTLFTVGDQLLWGAAEPLRRFLRILSRE